MFARCFRKKMDKLMKLGCAVEVRQFDGEPFNRAAELKITEVGFDYIEIESVLGGVAKKYAIPFSAIQYVSCR